jgi:hypothetical protein
MLSTIKNWFVRMWIPDVEPNEDDEKLNPLGWGTLFFSVWVSLKVLKELNPKMKVTLFQIVLEWALLAVSVILLFAIYIVPWRDILKKFTQKYYAFPIVFIITVFSFILGWVPGLGLTGMNQWLAAGIGFLWFITPIMIIIARFKRLLTRGLICIVFLGLWIHYFMNKGFIGSWPLLAIGLLAWWPCICPKRFRDISVI